MTPELELLDIWEAAAAAAPAARGVALLRPRDPDDLLRMPVSRVDARLFALRRDWFGDSMTGIATCAHCGARIELELRASDFVREEEPPATFRAAGRECRLPDTRDLMAVASLDAAAARRALATRIAAADALTGDEVDAIGRALEEADPGGDVHLVTNCPECGERCETVIDPAAFLFSEVTAAASRVLRDVHALAAAYGWSEEQVLALPPSRRRLYVEMVSG